MNIHELERLGEERAVKLEITRGIPTWEAFPNSRHQKAIFRIQASVETIPGKADGCSCFHLADTYIRFADGSLKRPDIAIFCQEPPDSDEAIEITPMAVVEVLSKGYELKDTEIGAPFYLEQGVLDVVLFDPRTLDVIHLQKGSEHRYKSQVIIDLQCGCRVTV